MSRLGVAGGVGALGGFVVGRYLDEIESGGHKIFHQPPKQPASSSELLQAVRSVTKDAGSFAVLSTRNANEGVSSRVVLLQDPFGLEDSADGKGLRVIFNTNLLSKKVVQMRNQPQCSLLFFNPKKLEFVSYEGQCKQITQSDAKHVWWREWLRLFYPEGPDGSRFSVWELRPEKVQLVSGGKGLESTREDWQSPELRLNHSTKLWERVDVK